MVLKQVRVKCTRPSLIFHVLECNNSIIGMENITYIGITNWRNQNKRFGIKDYDRLGHIYVIGKTGVGKSTLLLNMAISDIEHGKGICVIDPHGDLSEILLHHIPKERIKEELIFLLLFYQ